jgi:hypothetical protein
MSLDEKAEGCSLVPEGYYKCVCRTPQCNSFETPKAACARGRQRTASPTQQSSASFRNSSTTSVSNIPEDVSEDEDDRQPKYKYRFREQKLREQMVRMQLERSRGASRSSTSSPADDEWPGFDFGDHDDGANEETTTMRLINFARFPQHATTDVRSLVSHTALYR